MNGSQGMEACDMLNDSWLLLPQLRYACVQLLAGSIIINNKKEAVIALITSSLRIDSLHAANVGATMIYFDLATYSANTTHIFLDTSSIKKAKPIATSQWKCKMINRFDLLGQFRQVRSGFDAIRLGMNTSTK